MTTLKSFLWPFIAVACLAIIPLAFLYGISDTQEEREASVRANQKDALTVKLDKMKPGQSVRHNGYTAMMIGRGNHE